MTQVQAQPDPGILYTPDDIQKHVRRRLQNVFHADRKSLRQGFQKVLPEKHGLLHIPLRVVHLGIEASVKHQLPGAIGLCQSCRLGKAESSKLSCLRVNGAGEKLVEGAMEHPPGNTGQGFFQGLFHSGKLPVHIPGGAEFRDFDAQTVLPGNLPRLPVDGGYIQPVPYQNSIPFLAPIPRSKGWRSFRISVI